MIKPASVVFHAGLLRSCGIESPRCGRVALPPVYLPVWLAIGHRKPSGPGLTLCVRMWVCAHACPVQCECVQKQEAVQTQIVSLHADIKKVQADAVAPPPPALAQAAVHTENFITSVQHTC